MKKTRLASLAPGRASGNIETDPALSGPTRIMLLRQERLGDIAVLPAGLVLVDAAPFSHQVISWLGRGIPIARTDPGQAARWRDGEPVVLDTAVGEIRTLQEGDRAKPWRSPRAPAAAAPVCTRDGTAVWLTASVAGAEGAARAVAAGAAAIGLVRSEYLYPETGRQPTPAFYRRAFSGLLASAAPLTVAVRLLDLATDKRPPWLSREGEDAVSGRLHGSQVYGHPCVRAVVDAQIAVMEDLPQRERLRLIWPAGGCLDDFLQWREDTRRRLPATMPIGAMVESPIEVLAIRRWVSEADFVSIGCNDLVSGLCGADRDEPHLHAVLDPYRPELFRFLRTCADQAGTGLGQVQLCGLLPQIEGVLPVLIGLGYRRFSGEPALIPLLARSLATTTLTECRALAGHACASETSRDLRDRLGVPMDVPWGLVRDLDAQSGCKA